MGVIRPFPVAKREGITGREWRTDGCAEAGQRERDRSGEMREEAPVQLREHEWQSHLNVGPVRRLGKARVGGGGGETTVKHTQPSK